MVIANVWKLTRKMPAAIMPGRKYWVKSIFGPPPPIADSSPPKTTEKMPSMMIGKRKLNISASFSRKKVLTSRAVR
jgi:hypothetical protein